jgi:hypothetical protein
VIGVIWAIVAVGIALVLLVYAWGQAQIRKPPPQKPSYWELQRVAYRQNLPPGCHTYHWRGRPFNVLVGDHNRVEPDPHFGKYWR